jgi:hypothetical protein
MVDGGAQAEERSHLEQRSRECKEEAYFISTFSREPPKGITPRAVSQMTYRLSTRHYLLKVLLPPNTAP